jgi:hypothetical protein
MPFDRSTVPLPTSPDVTVELTGLLLFMPANNSSSCAIGVHRTAPDHKLEIALVVCEPGKPPCLVPLHSGNLESEPFSIRVTPDSHRVSAWKPTLLPFDRANPANDETDLQWAVDINQMHPEGLNCINVHPCVTIYDGIFYTRKKSKEEKVDVDLVRGTSHTNLHSIAGTIGVAITLSGQSKVLLDWRNSAGPQTENLPREGDLPGTTYVLSIRNVPPPPATTPGHNEMAHYYEVLRRLDGSEVPAEQKFDLNVTLKPVEETRPGIRKTDEIPCMPTIFGP